MRKAIIAATGVALLAVLIGLGFGQFASQGRADAGPRAISVLGVAHINGQDTLIDILAVVPPRQDEQTVAARVLRDQGARPADPRDLRPTEYAASGLVWNQFLDADPGNDFVTQYYNPSRDPTGSGEAALLGSEAAWTGVATSSFAFQYDGQTSRCPSLVKECPGPQRYDSKNDVAWLSLTGCCTLGVTWYSTSTDEADMALNANFPWSTGCTDQSGSYDVQTVFTHENGHVLGLSHSNDTSAVMFAYYGGARCQLTQDDIDGVSFLYPSSATPPATSTPTPTATTGAASTPTPTATTGGPAPTSTPCPAGWYKNGRC